MFFRSMVHCTPLKVSSSGRCVIPYCEAAGTIHHLARGVYGTEHCIGKSMRIPHFNLRPENVMADLCLGVTIVGVYTLIGVGLFIVFI